MEHTNSEKLSLEIQPLCSDAGPATETECPQRHEYSNPYPEITQIAVEIGRRGKMITTSSAVADPTLDPNSPSFIPRKWIENILRSANDTSWKSRQMALVLKSVDIIGAKCTEEEQKSVFSVLLWPFRIRRARQRGEPTRILRNIDGFIQPGQLLLILGRPGSGCSSLLKTIGGNLGTLSLGENSTLHYNGITHKTMSRNFKGEAVYNAESDIHFPHLTVKQTLEFAAALRMPRNRVVGQSKEEHIQQMTAVAMAMCGLAHVQDVKVGSDYIRGVSGGERKRVSIAEMVLARASIGCWDNSTCGLDSATALQFVTHLRMTADLVGIQHIAALYQASEAIYELFDKVLVLYEGRAIYFGSAAGAKLYFEDMGWFCEPRQSTPDFLTAITNHAERKVQPGFRGRVPHTPDEFELAWRSSNAYRVLQEGIRKCEEEISVSSAERMFRAARGAAQGKFMPAASPYTVDLWAQFQACLKRAFCRSRNNQIPTMTTFIGQLIMALVVGSLFYRLPSNTDGFFSTGSVLFFVLLLNTVVSVTEINTLYEQRPITQKHVSYAFFRPFIDSLATLVLDLPVKLIIGTCFNITLYFLAGLRSEVSTFFIFYLASLLVRFIMSSIFRTIGSITKMYYQALAIAGVLLLASLNYTGFTLPRSYMHPWFKWITWINPLAYALEVMMVNQVNGLEYPCTSFVPNYPDMSNKAFICPVPGAIPGQTTVIGNSYVESSFNYSYNHLWRDVGILFGFWVFFTTTYLLASELNLSASETPGVIRFLLKDLPKSSNSRAGAEAGAEERSVMQELDHLDQSVPCLGSENILFLWEDAIYEVNNGDQTRRLLHRTSGWIKSGSLTALMGVSGAGKTTLLDFLARRLKSGVRSGSITLFSMKSLPEAFGRLGYVPQQDVLLETATVREALRFSAILRQPRSASVAEKYRYVEDIILVLGLQDFANAIIGPAQNGLSKAQRKLVSIGVELASKPQCLLFLDEPTSGLDSESSLAIVASLERLAKSGMAVLATIHQPSAVLLQKFDRLLFLAKGGKTVYFGDVGPNSKSVIEYFESHGARECNDSENPAEFLLEILTSTCNSDELDWAGIWRNSEKKRLQEAERDSITAEMSNNIIASPNDHNLGNFEAPLYSQILWTSIRTFQQHWRTPSYVWGKLLLGMISSLFIGFSFYQSPASIQGTQNTIFSIFMVLSILSPLLQQIMPRFMINRALYEVREGPSKTYSWISLIISNVIVEIPYQIIISIIVYACYYYPVYGIQPAERQGLILLYCIQYFLFATTFGSMISAATPDSQTAATIATLLFSMAMVFNGVFQPPDSMPEFWKFMYYVSPFTYIIGGMAATGLHERLISCSENELSVMDPPPNYTCGEYLQDYLDQHHGMLYNPSATAGCQYCPISNADQFLSNVGIYWKERWRNFGLVWAYVAFNCLVALLVYYGFRVQKWRADLVRGKVRNFVRNMWAWLPRNQEN